MTFRKPAALLLSALLPLACAGCSGKTDRDPASSTPTLNITVEQSPLPADWGLSSAAGEPAAADPAPTPDTSEPTTPAEPTPAPTPETQTVAVYALGMAALYPAPDGAASSAFYPDATALSVEPTDDPAWYRLTLPGADGAPGQVWYLYGMTLSTTPGGTPLLAQSVSDKFAWLQGLFPDGQYWNHAGNEAVEYGQETPLSVSQTPCEHSVYGELDCNFYTGATGHLDMFPGTMDQCLGFASFLSDQLFGQNAPIHAFWDIDLLQPGDHIRYDAYEHSVTVLTVEEDGVTLAECNRDYEDCLIEWGRFLSFDELEALSWDLTFLSRYPLCPDGAGGYVPWDSEDLTA